MEDVGKRSRLAGPCLTASLCLMSVVALVPSLTAQASTPKPPSRPETKWGAQGPTSAQLAAYDSKARASAETIEVLRDMILKGWILVRKYYPKLGLTPEGASIRVNPSDDNDGRFYAYLATEDSGNSPIPLISMICSLDATSVTGRLAQLRAELLPVTRLPDYSTWDAERLRQSVRALTVEQTTTKGVRYRAPRNTLTFQQSVELYAMSVALLAKDDRFHKWTEENSRTDVGNPPFPDLQDFSKRLSHQLPTLIPPGATRGFLLYLPGWDLAQPVRKGELEEKMDVVRVQRAGATFTVEQFPVFLTNDQKQWNPEWIDEADVTKDPTLSARKYSGLWTRLDGPYMWFKRDQFIGPIAYQSTVRFGKDEITIEAERFVRHRGDVVRAQRDPAYDPLHIERAAGGRLPQVPLLVEFPDLGGWLEMRHMIDSNYRDDFYRADNRELFWYKTHNDTWSSSLLLRDDAGEPALRPIRTAPVLTHAIVARYDGSGVARPDDASPLTSGQQATMSSAVQIASSCLANANTAEVMELRTRLPHDETEKTPIYFYAVRNGTSVVKAPTFEVVVLSEGYYSDVAGALNRLLWVLQKPLAASPSKLTAVQGVIEQCIRKGPNNLVMDESARSAWESILRDNQLARIFDPAILPTPPISQDEHAVPAPNAPH